MAFGISFADIELLIRLSQNQTAGSEPIVLSPDAATLPPAIIPVLSETLSSSDSFSTKNSETNIVAALTENIAPVSLTVNSGAVKSTKIEDAGNNKVADIVFNSAPQTNASSVKQAPVNAPLAANNISAVQNSKQSRMDAEIIFRSLLERFGASVVYDYEMSDAVRLEEDAAGNRRPFENSSRFADSSENGTETNRKKAIRDKENLKQEALRKAEVDAENQSNADEIRESKKRDLLRKIREANKFL